MASLRRRGASSSVPAAEVDNEKIEVSTDLADSDVGGLAIPFALLLAARLYAAGYSAIADCDETFNYWEPMHFITFGFGFQTWEYSPIYALRSYLFLLPHAGASYIFALLQGRPAAFFLTRGLQALLAVGAESVFVLSIARRFGRTVGRNTAILLALSPGMFVAAVAFLPSSIAMLQVCGVWALWLRGHLALAIFLGACAVVVVWPFTGLLFIPLGLHALYVLRPLRAIGIAITSFTFWSLLSLAVDSFFYGKTILPVYQILRYNVFDRKEHGGSELYGVEPWYFYLINGLLNLNVALPAALSLPVLVALRRLVPASKSREESHTNGMDALAFSSSAFVWFVFFSLLIPHKEERFLAPVYPLLVFAGAVAIHILTSLLLSGCQHFLPRDLARSSSIVVRQLGALAILTAALLSLSRIAALQTSYTAPLPVYQALNSELSSLRKTRGSEDAHVCIGVEWYRFMSSFFLPDHRDHLSFVRFGPTGLLPAEFNRSLGTSGIPANMNDRNQEETSRYIEPRLCDFLIDLDIGEGQGHLPDLRQLKWDTVIEVPFLDSSRSRQPWRSFYVPWMSARKNAYASYRLLRRQP